MDMKLYIDIGNSDIVIGKGNGSIEETYRYHTDMKKSGDEYYALLKHLFHDVDDVVIASVAPIVNDAFKTFMQRYFGIRPLFVGPGVKTGVRIKTDYPQEVGADLVAAAAGAIAHYGRDAIIIDMGTATTFTYMEEGEIKGVSITIGLDTSKDALVERAQQLLQFEFQKPEKILGTNTIEALNAGFLHGHVFQIEGMVESILSAREEKDIPVLVIGGSSRHLEGLLPKHYRFDEHLVLKGLVAISEKNE